MLEWESKVHLNKNRVDGVGPWVWVNNDKGVFEMIARDWASSHYAMVDGIGRRRTVIQAGGNMGMYPRLLSDKFTKVYTFEPHPVNFFCLTHNCQKENIFKYQGFLLDKPGFHGLTVPSYRDVNEGEYTMLPYKGGIPAFIIDSFGFDDVDLIWLDTEGTEFLALSGAAETIKRSHPVIVVEQNKTFEDVKKYLEGRAYVLVDQTAFDMIYAWTGK